MQPRLCSLCSALFQMCSGKHHKTVSVKLKHTELGGGDRETNLGLNRRKNQVDKQNQVGGADVALRPGLQELFVCKTFLSKDGFFSCGSPRSWTHLLQSPLNSLRAKIYRLLSINGFFWRGKPSICALKQGFLEMKTLSLDLSLFSGA